MGDHFHYEKLSLLNQVYHNAIKPQEEFLIPHVKTRLYPHQTALVKAMRTYRDKMTNGFLIGNQALNSKIGIIGDPAGTGKSLSVLAFLAMEDSVSHMTCELSPNSSKYFFSHDLFKTEQRTTNLIIVSQVTFSQWQNEIDTHTTLSYVPIETKRNLKEKDLTETILQRRFILTTNKSYKYVQEYATANHISWNHIVMDDASHIYMNSSEPKLNFQFLWLVTHHWIPLLFKNPTINKSTLFFLRDRVNLHPELENWLLDDITVHCDETLVSSAFLKDYLNFYHPHRGQMVLRNSMEALQSSMKLPVIQTEVLQCRPNLSLHTMSAHYVSKNIEAYIQVNKVPYLFQSLGIQFIELEHYLSFQTDNKYTLIRRRVQENECIICMEKCAYPTIINCCYSVFCGKCVLKNTVLNHKCPICREMLTTNNICCLSALQDEDVIQARNKIEVCLDVLRTNKSEKFIIYSVFENIYFQLFEKMNQMGLTVEKIDSNLPTRLKSIRNFKNGVTNVLFVSDVHLIHGISLATTSHLIFYHELNAYETKQVLIHSAQRLGRTQPLKIIHLNSGI